MPEPHDASESPPIQLTPARIVANRWPLVMAATALPFLALATWELMSGAAVLGAPASDYILYRDAASRWLAGGSFYEPWQLDGPYAVWGQYGAILYPPPILLLLVPFTALPGWMWWAIPIGLTVAVVIHHRPYPAVWPFIAMGIAWPNTTVALAHGNPTMWIVAFLAAGTVLGWPSVGVLLKPTLAPFALVGAGRRSWWIALAAAFTVSIPFGVMWAEWLRAVTGASDVGLLYSAQEIPTMLIPLVVWLGSTRGRPALRRRRRPEGPKG